MNSKRKNWRRIAAIILVWLAALIFYLVTKTTIGAGLAACISERVFTKDYLKIGMMPEGDDFSTYKDKVVYQIRVDKAERIRLQEEEQRTGIAKEFLRDLAYDIVDAYTYNEEYATLQENLQKYNTFMSDFKPEFVTEEEGVAIKELVDGIAGTVKCSMATDAYYPAYSQDYVRTQMSSLFVGLSGDDPQEEFVIEQITPGEYDPEPTEWYGKTYGEDIELLRKRIGEEVFDYDYITQFTLTYAGDNSESVIEVCLVAIVNKDNCILIDAGTAVDDEKYSGIIADGNVRPFSDTAPVEMNIPEVPVILSLEGMQEKADEFIGLFEEMLTAYFADEDALNELYEIYIKDLEEEETEEETKEGTEEEVEEISEDYDDVEHETVEEEKLKIEVIEEQINNSIEAKYSPDKEWGSIILLESFSEAMVNAVDILLVERFMEEGIIQIDGIDITEQDKAIVHTQAEAIRKTYTNVSEPLLIDSHLVVNSDKPSTNNATPVAMKSYESLCSEFETGYSQWNEDSTDDVPQGMVGGYFRYEFEDNCIVEIAILGTNKGLYITDVGIDWLDENTPFQDVTVSTYNVPNTIRMIEEAQKAIRRENYETEEEYDYAIANWLYENYPDYYNKPISAGNSKSKNNISYSNGGLLKRMRKIVEQIDDSIEFSLRGTLPGYLFTDNGGLACLSDDYDILTRQVEEDINDRVDEIKSDLSYWWDGLWD